MDYLTVKFTNVAVLSYQTGGDAGDDRLSETVVLHFESVHGEYKPVIFGKPGPVVPFDISGACP